MSETSIGAEFAGKPIGALLGAVREQKGLPIEQVARDTRIRVQRLREIESDNFSHFSHPSYARLFLADYAKYLGIPAREIRPMLPDAGECGSEGYQYLQELSGETKPVRMTRRILPRKRLLSAFAGVAVFFAALVCGFQIWKTMRNLDRIKVSGTTVQTDRAELLRVDEVVEAIPVRETLIQAEVVEPQASEEPVATEEIGEREQVAVDEHTTLFVGGTLERPAVP